MLVTSLTDSLLSGGLPICGVSGPVSQQGDGPDLSTWHQLADSTWVRVDWTQSSTQTQEQQAASIIAAYSVLADAKAQAIDALTQQMLDTIDASFNGPTRDWMLLFLLLAMVPPSGQTAMPNRASYLLGMATWAENVYAAYNQAVAAVNAATTVDDVNAVTLTLQAAPEISLDGAMAITN